MSDRIITYDIVFARDVTNEVNRKSRTYKSGHVYVTGLPLLTLKMALANETLFDVEKDFRIRRTEKAIVTCHSDYFKPSELEELND